MCHMSPYATMSSQMSCFLVIIITKILHFPIDNNFYSNFEEYLTSTFDMQWSQSQLGTNTNSSLCYELDIFAETVSFNSERREHFPVSSQKGLEDYPLYCFYHKTSYGGD